MIQLYSILSDIIASKFQYEKTINIELTNPDHDGDISILVFPIAKELNKNLDECTQNIGQFLIDQKYISSYNVIKGFLNCILDNLSWNLLSQESKKEYQKEKIVIEFCGPNTNKPLHIGHLRNAFLGDAMSNILNECGHEIIKVNINNDRGIAICKSQIAYSLYGNNTTPESTDIKGDHFIGNYYVKYNEIHNFQVSELVKNGMTPKEASTKTEIYLKCVELLKNWENGDTEIINQWSLMNSWFYEGVNITLSKLNIFFDKQFYESTEYLKGKELIESGLATKVFEIDENGSIFIDLTKEGLDRKIVQRNDGTSIYITQDIALINTRAEMYDMDRMIYVVGDEQNYHFKVLKLICEKLEMKVADKINHLSYGMVVSNDGSRFKSREGNTVDADDIIEATISESLKSSNENGKLNHLSSLEKQKNIEKIGIGALKFSLLKINPKKNIKFDPKETVDLQGDTGVFVMYSYVRTKAILKKANFIAKNDINFELLDKLEKKLLLVIYNFPTVLNNSAQFYDPSILTNYTLTISKAFNKFYNQNQILNVEDEALKSNRLEITFKVNTLLNKCMNLLSILPPDSM